MIEEMCHRRAEFTSEVQQYHLVLIRDPVAAAAAPPESLWRPDQSSGPRLHWSGTRRTLGRFCRIGRWSLTELGSWTECRSAAAAWCGATQ